YVIATQWNLPIVCVALVGTHASRRQLMMFQDIHQRAGYVPILISLDADEAGRQASHHLFVHLNREKQIAMELALLANIKDIGDLGIHPQGRTLLQAVLEQALCS
ncbi:MAG: hypothetical protein JO215_07935, partial [Ktedonobacteraceae bacterium]|nr:hypothetical protein [Ktedonobacteraceae bacterium]